MMGLRCDPARKGLDGAHRSIGFFERFGVSLVVLLCLRPGLFNTEYRIAIMAYQQRNVSPL